MTGPAAGWRAALRIARREARRAKGRSALVITLIGLPALALTFTAVSYDMFTLTPEERLTRDLGTADAELDWFSREPVIQRDSTGGAIDLPPGAEDHDVERPDPLEQTAAEVLALLPAGSRVSPRWEGEVTVATATGAAPVHSDVLDLGDPLTRGIVRVTGGRAPAAAGEVALTDRTATRLGAAVGDGIELRDSGDRLTVVGTVEYPDDLSARTALFHPSGWSGERGWRLWLAATPQPVTWDQVTELNQHGLLVHSRAVALDPPPEVAAYEQSGGVDGEAFAAGVLVAGLAVLEVVLLAGPAFAVGARRRQRELALVAAGGGTPAQLRRIVLADGIVLGTLGAGTGIALGVVAAFAAHPLVEAYLMGTRAGGFRVFPLALAGIAAVAIGTGVLAALVPAVTTARQQVVVALAGRRGATGIRKRWPVIGLVLVGLGTAVSGLGVWWVSAPLVLAGLVAGQLGLVLCTPAIVGLVARLGSRLPLAPRMALRDTARNRAAAAPAISAVMAAVAGATAAGVVLVSLVPSGDNWYTYPPGSAVVDGPWQWPEEEAPAVTAAEAERMVRGILPVAEVHELAGPGCASESGAPAERDVPAQACAAIVEVPAEHRCPYWDAPLPLPRSEQRAAKRDPRCGSDLWRDGQVEVVDDGTSLAAVTGADPADLAGATAVLREGGAVVFDRRFLSDGMVTIQSLGWDEQTGAEVPVESVTVPARLVPLPRDPSPIVIIPPVTATALGLNVLPGPLLVTTTRTPTQAEGDALAAAAEALGGYGYVVSEPAAERDPMLLLLAAAAAVIALGAAGIATGLAAADRRPDLATLGAVGASPRVRRSLSLSQSGVIAGLGTGLGLLAGLGIAAAGLAALNQRYASTWPSPDPVPLTVPWANLAALLAVPLVAMLGAGLLTRSRLPVERRRLT